MIAEHEDILVTGSTGFLGHEIVRRLLSRDSHTRLLLPVRSRGHRSAQQRVAAAVAHSFPASERSQAMARLEVFEGDVSRERMGLPDADYRSLARRTTRIIHSAADVQFDRPIAKARRVNVGGTETVLLWAQTAQQEGALRSLTHVSTSFVAGRRTGPVLESELDMGQRFRNSYERSKCEAEKLVQQAWSRLPALVVRPSIIVGDSETGMTTSFKAMYWPLKMYANRRWRTVPGYPDAVADIVPVNFVADATIRLAFSDRAVGRCYHLCAGPEGCATVRDMAALAADFFDVPPPCFVNPSLFYAFLHPLFMAVLWGSKRRILRTGKMYRPYFSMRSVFDTSNAREHLASAGLVIPPVSEYVTRLFEYCQATQWGRRPYRAAHS